MDPLVHLTLGMALALLFAASAAHQLVAWPQWPGIVRNYRLVPQGLAGAASIAIPCAEAVTAAALLWAPLRPLGGVSAALLLALFAAAVGINLDRGRTWIDCGCFGSGPRTGLSRWMVVRNLALAALALALCVPPASRALSPFEIVAALALVATLAFLYPALDLVLRHRASLLGVTEPSNRRRPGAG
jgi:hypothetical protein